MIVSATDLQNLEDSLLNTAGDVQLHERFRTLFTLRALESDDAVNIIVKGFGDSSALLKHELAYCLGQMKNTTALPALESVLRDATEDPMVRHEAAEAMGAISATKSIDVLRQFLSDPERSVRETCEIAMAKIEWDNSAEGRKHLQQSKESSSPKFSSIDPAPATIGVEKPGDVSKEKIGALRKDLVDTSIPLFRRYRAMFTLRNIGTADAISALASGFSDDSALFKHEIAFIFGQLLSPEAVPSLIDVLRNTNESDMVRHEAAEALGAIATPEVLPHLIEWMARADSPRVVQESCEVAIDMWEHENSGEFQYANGLISKRDVATQFLKYFSQDGGPLSSFRV